MVPLLGLASRYLYLSSGGHRLSQTERGANPKGAGANLLFWSYVSRKLHGIEEIVPRGEGLPL